MSWCEQVRASLALPLSQCVALNEILAALRTLDLNEWFHPKICVRVSLPWSNTTKQIALPPAPWHCCCRGQRRWVPGHLLLLYLTWNSPSLCSQRNSSLSVSLAASTKPRKWGWPAFLLLGLGTTCLLSVYRPEILWLGGVCHLVSDALCAYLCISFHVYLLFTNLLSPALCEKQK